ncbi:MAG: hypothetical protein F6K09_32295, partial [Merismopedia sp. SIO2A8]|nr:hypothetical protein [Merismopedia sp. SIO2A8]
MAINPYLLIKFIHILSVAVWAFSTTVAYFNYLAPTFTSWEKAPNDPFRKERRNWSIEQFDQGTKFEHIAFPTIITTGLLLLWLEHWPIDQVSWFTVKLMIVILIFIPMEIMDYYLSHFGGS